MKLMYTKVCGSRDDAIVEASAAKQDEFDAVIVGPVQIARYGNKAGDQSEVSNPNDSNMWIVVAANGPIDVSFL